MKIIKPQTLGLLTRPFEFRRDFWLGVSVLAFLPIGDAPVLLKETEMWPFLAEELPPDQPLDAAIPKAQPEFLAVAHCFAPDGVAAPLVQTGIQLGPVIKRLDVHGDRDLDRRAGRISQAVPFTHMPLDWTRTYGGPEFRGQSARQGHGAGRRIRRADVPGAEHHRSEARPGWGAGSRRLRTGGPDVAGAGEACRHARRYLAEAGFPRLRPRYRLALLQRGAAGPMAAREADRRRDLCIQEPASGAATAAGPPARHGAAPVPGAQEPEPATAGSRKCRLR